MRKPFCISPSGEADISDYGAHPIEEEGYETFDSTMAIKAALLEKNKVTINTAGTYLINQPLVVHSNTELIAVNNVTLKKASGVSHAITNNYVEGAHIDKQITISNITIDDDSLGGTVYSAESGNGIINLFHVEDVTLCDITIINGGNQLYGVHLQSSTNVNVTNYTYTGAKDGFHINAGCEDIVIDGFDISSVDDAFAILAEDYPRPQMYARDIRNITIKNGVSNTVVDQLGYFLRLTTGSWLDWTNGSTYKIGHICKNDGKLYKKYNSGDVVASIVPTHTSGRVTGADGIEWKFIGIGDNYKCEIFDVYVYNVTLDCGRKIYRYVSKDVWDNSEYPGTENTSIVDNLHTTLSEDNFINTSGLLGNTYFDEVYP